MTLHDDIIPLEHMAEAAKAVLEWTAGRDWSSFRQDVQLQAAVTYEIQIIGEAARRLSQSFRDAHPAIPWQDMIAMRNVVVHRYDRVDPGLLWRAVAEDLPVLVAQLTELLPPEDG